MLRNTRETGAAFSTRDVLSEQEGARRREEMEAKSPFCQISVQTRDLLFPGWIDSLSSLSIPTAYVFVLARCSQPGTAQPLPPGYHYFEPLRCSTGLRLAAWSPRRKCRRLVAVVFISLWEGTVSQACFPASTLHSVGSRALSINCLSYAWGRVRGLGWREISLRVK